MSSITAGTTSTTTLIHSGDTTGSLVFKTNDTGSGGTTAVTIDTSQNVGIGTSSPLAILDVASSSNPAVRIRNTSTGGAGIWFGNSTSGTTTSDGANVGIDSGQQLNLWNYENTATLFATNNTERARIDSSGNLYLGITTTPGASAGMLFEKVGVINVSRGTTSSVNVAEWRNPNGVVGTIATSGSSTTYNTSSDYRLKENIYPMTGALAKVAQLKPVTYKWKVDGADGEGFIAHELAEVVPDCVTGEKDAVDAEGNPVYQGIDTSFLVATLTAAIQELKAINDQQAETINALTARIVALEGA